MTVLTLLTKANTVITNIVKRMRSFLLKQDGFYLLTQSGDKLIIQPDTSEIVNQTKNATILTNEIKH